MYTFSTSERQEKRKASVLDTFDFQMCFVPQRRTLVWHLNVKKWSEPGSFWHFWLGNVLRATTACTFSTSQLPKVVRICCFVHFELGNVLRATTACTFSTSQLPKVVRTCCFVHFDLDMCFAPQRRALFRHLNFQKWSYISAWTCASRHNGVHFFDISTSKSGRTFGLGHVLRATMARNF